MSRPRCVCGSRINGSHISPAAVECWRCRRARTGHKCGYCNQPTNRTKFCSGICRHKHEDATNRARGGVTILPRECHREGCLVVFTPKRDYGRYCSRKCANFATRESRKERRYSPQTQERIHAHYGPPIIPPLAPPLCHGFALAFGSDPTTGASIQYCAVCGEKPLQRHGEISYSQGKDRKAELEAFIERSKRVPKKAQSKGGSSRSWQRGFQVVSKALKDKIEAA